MTVTTLITYCTALFIAAVIPGPGMTAILARALGSGIRPTLVMAVGLFSGDIIYLSAVLLGLSYLAQSFVTVFLVIKIAGALYLVFVAWKLWTSGLMPMDVEARRDDRLFSAFLSGLFITLGNPKTMLFYVALAPTLLPVDSITLPDFFILAGLTFGVLMMAIVPYVVLATRARAFLRTPGSMKVLNKSAAGIMAGTAAYITAHAS